MCIWLNYLYLYLHEAYSVFILALVVFHAKYEFYFKFTHRPLVHQPSFLTVLLVGIQPYPFTDAQRHYIFYIIEIVKYFKMDFHSILISVLRQFPTGKWLPFGQTVEGVSKHSNFFNGIWWPNSDIVSYTALYKYLVLLR